jgi:tRNA(fMet)-specific endonuclease VapC
VAVRVALDTNGYSALCRGDERVLDVLEHAEAILLPFVVLAELRAGFAVGSRGRDNERILRRFLTKPGVEILLADEVTCEHYAKVYRQLRTQGTPIPTNNLWIAALVLQHKLALLTLDRHFEQLPQIELV